MATMWKSVAIWMGIPYVGFCLLLPLGAASIELIGELADVLVLSTYLWPYPLLLSLQGLFEPGNWACILGADILGLGLVLVWGFGMYHMLPERVPIQRVLKPWGVVLWYVPLLVFQILVYLLALGADWPMGE